MCLSALIMSLSTGSRHLCFEVMNSQTGATLGQTESTTNRQQHSFDVHIKLPQSLIDPDTSLTFKLRNGPQVLAEGTLRGKEITFQALPASPSSTHTCCR